MNLKFVTFLLTLAIFVFASRTFSEEVCISISPIRVEHLVKQGERGTDMIAVTNGGTSPLRIKVSIQNWTLSHDGIFQLIQGESDPFYCGRWVRINPVDFRLDPGQTRDCVTLSPSLQML